MPELPLDEWASSHTFYDLIPREHQGDERKSRIYVKAHLEYLQEVGLLELDAPTLDGTYHLIKLTAEGRHFVQPELGEFYAAVTGQLVSAVEAEIEQSSLPKDQKQGFRYKLRESLIKHGPEAAVRLIVEILKHISATG